MYLCTYMYVIRVNAYMRAIFIFKGYLRPALELWAS